MGTLSNNQFWIHGPNSGSEETPNFSIKFTVTGTCNGKTHDATLKYEVSLNSLSGASFFGYDLKIYAGPSTRSPLIINKPYTDSQWSSTDYSGSVTSVVNIPSVDSEGNANIYITVVANCNCSGYNSGRVLTLGKMKVINPGSAPKPATCSVDRTSVLVGKTVICTYSGNRCEVSTRNKSGSWSSWTSWGSPSKSSYTIPRGHTVSAVKFRSYNYNENYWDPTSDYRESQVVYSKLNPPSVPSFSNPVTYPNSVTATSSHPAGSLSYNWINPKGVVSSTTSTVSPTESGYVCKCRASLSNFTTSDWSQSSQLIVVCPAPTSVSYSPVPVIYNETATLSYNIVDGCVADTRAFDGSVWIEDVSQVVVKGLGSKFGVRSTRNNCEPSDWVYASNFSVKLPTPTNLLASPSPVTVDLVVRSSCTSAPTNTTKTYKWYSPETTEVWQGDSLQAVHDFSPFLYFKVKSEMSGYVSSDWSSLSSPVPIYLEPRDMTNSGFSVDFSIPSSPIPGLSVSSSWSSFLPTLNKGRFNYYKLRLVSEDEVLEEVSGSNDPYSPGSSSMITLGSDTVGKSCKLRLVCFYKNNTSLYEGDTHESEVFQVIGSPNKPEILYPSSTTSTIFNPLTKIIFKVSNPDYLDDLSIYDIKVVQVEGANTKTYTYKKNPGLFKVASSETVPTTIPNKSILTFSPEVSQKSTRKYNIYCTNKYLESKSPLTLTLNLTNLSYSSKGSKVVKSSRDTLNQVVTTLSNNYSNFSESYQNASSGELLINKSFFKNLLTYLSSLCEKMIGDYFTVQYPVIEFDQVLEEISSDEKVLVTSDQVSSSSPVPGNYFNDVIYVLKNLL